MLNLASTSDVLKVVTGSALNTDVHASWVDLSGTTPTPGRTNTAIASAATTNVVAAPSASTVRNVKTLLVRNKDASSSNAITVQHFDGTTTVDLFKVTGLGPGCSLSYNENDGFTVTDANGALLNAPTQGRLLKTTTLVSGTSFTTGSQTNSIRVRMVGGGGGGSGCTSVAAAAAAGGGGGAGGYAEKLFATSPNTAYAYVIGAAGTGTSGAAGGNGGDTTFTVGGVTVTAKGGTGAVVATALTTLVAYAGAAGGVVGTNGDVNASGEAGAPGATLIVATPIVSSGSGGAGPFGEGGVGITAVGNGNAGTGNGSGGGGSATGASAARVGGVGTVGAVVVDEYA